MKDEKKRTRHEAISLAAYTVLAAKGYDGASMLNIAKAAKASNETLYRWYGDKKGLFGRLVEENAVTTEEMLKAAIKGEADALQTLKTVAPVFLTMLLGDRAILLNRAAAAEPTGELGALLSAGGRDRIQPLFEAIMQQLAHRQVAQSADAKQLTAWFLGLLIGDLQIKRIIGVTPALSKAEIEARSQTTLTAFCMLLSETAEATPKQQ